MPRGENQFGRILFDMFQDIDVEDGIEFLLVVEIREHTHEDFAVLQVRRELIRFANAESGSKHTHRLCAPSFNARVVPPIPAPTSRTSPTKYGRSWDWTYDFQLFA